MTWAAEAAFWAAPESEEACRVATILAKPLAGAHRINMMMTKSNCRRVGNAHLRWKKVSASTEGEQESTNLDQGALRW
jgi:hypothetical protein